MKVEFLVNTEINDGRQIFISAAEFEKARNNDEEFNSFAFATHALFAFYGADDFINRSEYEKILEVLDKHGAVIITVVDEGRQRRVYPEVFVSNNNRLKRVDL
jgi:hypothetical protein